MDTLAALINDLTNLTRSFCDGGSARSVFISDIPGQLRIAHNAERLHPPASLAKVLIAETAVHIGLDFTASIPVTKLHATAYPSILNAFDADRELSLRELMSLSLTTSDNASADYVLDLVGIDRVNKRAQELGMTHTHIATGFRDDEFNRGDESTTCANDMARLLEEIYSKREVDGHRRIWRALTNNLRNTRIPGLLPDELVVAHKTGSLNGLAHDAGVLLLPNTHLVLVVLTEHEPVPLRTSLEIASYARAIYDCITN